MRLTLCAMCGMAIRRLKDRGRRPRFPTEAIAVLNNLDYLLLLRRTGAQTYRVVGWR